jgi:hypothetical protein
MADFQKFHAFTEALAEKKHDLGSDVLKVFLTNDTPSPSSDSVKNDITELNTGTDGYSAGGNTCSTVSSSQNLGIYTLTLSDPATWTSTGTIGPFRWVVLYNETAANKDLIGFWDYGSSITLSTGETFKVDFSQISGVLTIT